MTYRPILRQQHREPPHLFKSLFIFFNILHAKNPVEFLRMLRYWVLHLMDRKYWIGKVPSTGRVLTIDLISSLAERNCAFSPFNFKRVFVVVESWLPWHEHSTFCI